MGDVNIKKVLVSNKNSFGEKKNYKCFIGYFCGNQKVKSLHIMLPKTTAYVKSYDGQTDWMYFLIKGDDLLEKYILFGIKSVLISKKSLIVDLTIIKKNYLKTKIKISHGDEFTDFAIKKSYLFSSN